MASGIRACGWLLLAAAAAGADGAPDPGVDGTRIAAWLRARRRELPFSLDPGVAIAVVSGHGASVELCNGFGLQDAEGAKAASERTLFEIGSLSKTLVALALATLVDQGRLHWDDDVAGILGAGFGFGPERYVRAHITLRDLLSHRSGLGEGQGDFFTAVHPSPELPSHMGKVLPADSLRSSFAYSNTAWELAGEVLRVVSNASSWCDALYERLLGPLGLRDTFCDRNDVPERLDAFVAGVHKASPCDGLGDPMPYFRRPEARPPRLRAFSLSRTGPRGAFAWGAADASGSALASAADLARVLALLLSAGKGAGAGVVPQVVQRETLAEMLSAQMVVPPSWPQDLGLPGAGDGPQQGVAFAAGLGFDLVGRLPSSGVPTALAGQAHAEKNGDTAMHKARLSLLPERGLAAVLLSNRGGSVGDALTALKHGVLALAAGANETEADDLVEAVLRNSGYWERQFVPDATCTACGTALSSFGVCLPGHCSHLPRPIADFSGVFGDLFYGNVLELVPDKDATHLSARLGPISTTLQFGPQNLVERVACRELGRLLQLPEWLLAPLAELAPVVGRPAQCQAVEFRVPAEVPAAGMSLKNRTVSFPWGCGTFPLPDLMPIILVFAEGADTGHGPWALLPSAGLLLSRAAAGPAVVV